MDEVQLVWTNARRSRSGAGKVKHLKNLLELEQHCWLKASDPRLAGSDELPVIPRNTDGQSGKKHLPLPLTGWYVMSFPLTQGSWHHDPALSPPGMER